MDTSDETTPARRPMNFADVATIIALFAVGCGFLGLMFTSVAHRM